MLGVRMAIEERVGELWVNLNRQGARQLGRILYMWLGVGVWIDEGVVQVTDRTARGGLDEP